MEFLIGLGLGFGAGYVFVQRPQWATDLLAKAKAKLGLKPPA